MHRDSILASIGAIIFIAILVLVFMFGNNDTKAEIMHDGIINQEFVGKPLNLDIFNVGSILSRDNKMDITSIDPLVVVINFDDKSVLQLSFSKKFVDGVPILVSAKILQ